MATASRATCRERDGMRPPKFHPNRSVDRRVIAFPTFCNMAVVRHLEFEFCYSGPPSKSTMLFDYRVKIWCRFDLPRRRYCDFIILIVWLENAYSRPPPLWKGAGGWGLNPLKLWIVIQTPKKPHAWVTTRHLSHKRLKSVQGCEKSKNLAIANRSRMSCAHNMSRAFP